VNLLSNRFKRGTSPPPPKSRLDRIFGLFLWLGVALVIGTWIAPGLVGTLVKSVGRTFGLLLLFLFLARLVSARIGELFGRPR
jgi:hypothetical protein